MSGACSAFETGYANTERKSIRTNFCQPSCQETKETALIMKAILKLTVVILVTTLPAIAQQTADAPRALTAADYARAEKWMGYNTNPLVFRAGVRPSWQGDDKFWYRVTTPEGSEFITVNTATGTKAPAFDRARLAAALSTAAGATFDAHRLP